MFIILFPPFVINIISTFTLSYRLEFCRRQKVSGCKALEKKNSFKYVCFFSYSENNVLIICLDLFVHE
jgi:hypothetical protein